MLFPLSVSYSSASQAGFVVGMFLGIGIVGGFYVFSIYAIIKAFRRRTWRWIIGGGIGGLILFATCLRIAFRVYETQSMVKPSAPPFPDSSISHMMQGWKMAYKIVLPQGWTPDWSDRTFDMTAQKDGLHLDIVAGASVGTSTQIAQMARSKIERVARESELTDLSMDQIDGRVWQKFAARFHVGMNLANYHYLYYVYSGSEGMFQMIGWRAETFHDGDDIILSNIAASFQFPPDPPSPPLTPRTVQATDFAYRLTFPTGWMVERSIYAYNLLAGCHNLKVGVIAQKGQLGTREDVLHFAQNGIRQKATNVQFNEISTVIIDRHSWLHFTARFQLKGILYVQEYHVYVGPEGTFQLVGWTWGNYSEQDKGTIHDVPMTFQFPTD